VGLRTGPAGGRSADGNVALQKERERRQLQAEKLPFEHYNTSTQYCNDRYRSTDIIVIILIIVNETRTALTQGCTGLVLLIYWQF